MLARHQALTRCARGPSSASQPRVPRQRTVGRCQTNQFSAHPAIRLLANSSTPVKAAYSAVGPSGAASAAYSASLRGTSGDCPTPGPRRSCTASTSWATDDHQVAEDAGRPSDQVRDLVDEALDCRVARVLPVPSANARHRRRRHRRLLVFAPHAVDELHDDEAHRVVEPGEEAADQNAAKPSETTMNLTWSSPTGTAPPAVAARSMSRYSARSRVM